MTAHTQTFEIAIIPGDGIGVDVIAAACAMLDELQGACSGFQLNYRELQAGARHYAKTGVDMTEDAFEAARQADAILLGAIGLPSIRHHDGTEISPHLRMREAFRLISGVRPVRAYPNTVSRLRDSRSADIDIVILRESTEGLFYSHGRGEVIGDEEARETLRITRDTSEKLFDEAFQLARRRLQKGRPGLVTCCDKANVFRAFAFFRKIFDERAALYPDIKTGYNYIDAMALDLIRRPWDFDILVMENMFGDIISDLAGGLVGGMGMAPCAEIGEHHGLFQPAHGSAPDIAGKGIANPTATLLSAALMLDWLGERHDAPAAQEAAALVETAIYEGYASRRLRPAEFGGDMGTEAMTHEVCALIRELAVVNVPR